MYDNSDIATSHSPFKCICSGTKFVKELRLSFGFSHFFFIKLSQIFFFVDIFDDKSRRFLVDIAEISRISSVNCGLYPFRNGISFLEILTLYPDLKFTFFYLGRGILCRTERKSVFLTSLGDFPIDLVTRQFIVDTNCGNL